MLENMLSDIINEYQNLIYTVVSGILGRHRTCDCEECTADVFVTFWQEHEKFDPQISSVKNYLVMLARRKAIDRLRKISVREADALTCDLEIFSDFDVSENVINQMNSVIVRDVIMSLESPDKEIFTMRYYYCMSVKMIAASIAKKPKFVEDRLYRAKNTIKKRLIDRKINI